MGLSQSLNTAMSGMRATQSGVALVASNVANANTPGYTRKVINQEQQSSGALGISVSTNGVSRELDSYIQRQLRAETPGGAYTSQIASILSQLQDAYGTPGASGTLETALSNFTASLQALSTNSGSPTAQGSALAAAQSLAQTLNATTRSVQTLRTSVEQDISTSVDQANAAMDQIQSINQQLQGLPPTDPTAAALMDQRDKAIDQLSQLIPIRVVIEGSNTATVFTTSGIGLVGTQAAHLTFNTPGTLTANSLADPDPTKSTVGQLLISFPGGSTGDFVAMGRLVTGRIAADLQLRDDTLVQAQTQLDQMAATMASALSDVTTNGSAVSAPPQAGFDLNLANVLPGNKVNITYTDKATNTQHQLTIIRVDDPAALPLPNTGGNPNNTTVGIDFSGGMASVVTQLNNALGSSTNLQFTNTGSVLHVLDNGLNAATVNAASVTTTSQTLANGNLQLPLFTDGASLYTGTITSAGRQETGFAGRISVNPALVIDPTKFTIYNTAPLTNSGDTSRSDFLYTQMASASFTYSPDTGLGSAATPYSGTLTNYLQQFLTLQANQSTNAQQFKEGQDIVVNNLQQKLDATSKVNIDSEMANLISLQSTYAANAHVMATVQSMMQALMQNVG